MDKQADRKRKQQSSETEREEATTQSQSTTEHAEYGPTSGATIQRMTSGPVPGEAAAHTPQNDAAQHPPGPIPNTHHSEPPAAPGGPLTDAPNQHIQRALEGTDTTQDDVPGQVLDVLSEGGQPLDGTIQRALEDRMAADFSDVRVHTGGTAAKAAEAIDAKAFTCGNDIVFNSGEYDPESPEGQHLLAHELAHVKQQHGGAPISMMPQEGANLEIDPDPQLEREADQAAEQALSGEEPLVVNRMGADVHIQRMPETGQLEQARQQASERVGTDETGVPADPEVLATEVERLKSNQEEMMAAFVEARPGAADSSPDVAGAAGKGLAGGVTGALVGSLLGPGGTAAGFAVGLASSVATDVSKEGMDWLMDNSPGSSALELEARVESLENRLAELRDEQYGHGGLEGVGKAGEVTK